MKTKEELNKIAEQEVEARIENYHTETLVRAIFKVKQLTLKANVYLEKVKEAEKALEETKKENPTKLYFKEDY